MKSAIVLFRDAARSAAFLYRELAVSAYRLVPYAQSQLREHRDARSREAGYPLTASLTTR